MASKRYSSKTYKPAARVTAAPTAMPPALMDERWMEHSLTRRLMPATVENILVNGLNGDLTDQLALFTVMQDTWPRLAHNVRTLREAVESAPFEVHAWTDDDGTPVTPTAEAKAALVKRGLWGMRPRIQELELGLEGGLRHLAGGTVQGHAVMEILWEMRSDAGGGTACLPRALRKTGSTHYAYPQGWTGDGQGDRLMFRPDNRTAWTLVDFPEHQFLTGIFPGHDGHPSVGAALRSLAKYWIAATYGPEWLMTYTQLFGSPFRWATYQQGKAGVKEEVCRMLANLGAHGWAAFPQGTELKIQEAMHAASSLPQKLLIDLADSAADILILGQTLSAAPSSDGGGSFALGKVHQTVRRERLEACGKAVATVLTHQLARAIVALNYGDDSECPEILCDLPEHEDEKAKAERDQLLSNIGMRFPVTYLYERHGVPTPAAGEATMGGTPAAPVPAKPKPGEEAAVKAARAPAGIPDPFLSDLTDTFDRVLQQAAADGYNALLGKEPPPDKSA